MKVIGLDKKAVGIDRLLFMPEYRYTREKAVCLLLMLHDTNTIEKSFLPEWIIAIEMLPSAIQFQLFNECKTRAPALDDPDCFMFIASIFSDEHFA